MAKAVLKIFAVLLLVLCAGDYRVFAGPRPPEGQDIELAEGWKLTSETGLTSGGEAISVDGYDAASWTPVRRMPGTVLEILQDAGVYPNLYYGTNLLTEVPQDLFRQDWWYRTTFTAPAGYQTYLLNFPGINYRAGIWKPVRLRAYWMLNSHWPSFFGNIFDYYLRPGGAYYGAKKGLRPLSVVFDSYATGDGSQAQVTVVNQSPAAEADLRVRVRTYDLSGKLRDERSAGRIAVGSGGAVRAVTLPPGPADYPAFFVRCELLDDGGAVLAENVYWQSQQPDDVGPPANDTAFESRQTSWADMTALNTIAQPRLEITASRGASGPGEVQVRLRNPTSGIAFFQRAELLSAPDGDEILPISYDDNYVTVFPGETVEVRGRVPAGGPTPGWVRVTGYGGEPVTAAVR